MNAGSLYRRKASELRTRYSSGAATNGNRVLFVQYMNPAAYPPIVHSAHILAEADALVRLIGIEQANTRSLNFGSHPRIQMDMMAESRVGWRLKVHYVAWAARALITALVWRARLVYVSDPMAAPVGLLAVMLGKRVIYHEHDAPPTSGPHLNGFMRCLVAMRDRLGRRADMCVFPGTKRRELFRSAVRTNVPLVSVMNCPRRHEVVAAQASSTGWGKTPVLHYHGSLSSTRLPESVIQALRLVPDEVRLQVIGYESPDAAGYCDQLIATAERLDVLGRLEILGPVPDRVQMLECAAQCSVGLLLMCGDDSDPNTQTMAGASNKMFEYAACGLAVIVSAGSGLEQSVLDAGIGVGCDASDPKSIANAIHELIEGDSAEEMAKRGRSMALKEWNYDAQFDSVRNWIVTTGLSPRPRRIASRR